VRNDTSRRVGDILPGVLATLGLEEKFEEGRLQREWVAVVGKAIASRSRPRVLRDGVLVVTVENSVWMQELWFRQREILERIGAAFPRLAVTALRFEQERERTSA